MLLHELLNENLSLIDGAQTKEASFEYAKSWTSKDETLFVSKKNHEQFLLNLERIYSIREPIFTRFTRQKIYKFVEDELIKYKKNKKMFTKDVSNGFFHQFEEQKPFSKYIIAPISGIRLDRSKKINISIFEIGKASELKSILSNDTDGYYIAVKIDDVYDDLVAIEEAKNKFSDFIRLIVFMSGKNDKRIFIKTGLPSYPSMSHQQMYVETSSYHATKNIENEFPNSSISSTYVEKIPVDNEFFYKNDNFAKLWDIYERQSSKKNTLDKRLLNASIAIGESALSRNIKNSIIYTSMAFEILFSFDEGSLFQKSIGDRLADTFAFIVAKDKEARLQTIKSVKSFYRLRSALVHGGDSKVNNDYIIFNRLLSAAISELLNNVKYKDVKNIDALYEMVKDAQNSY
jgi:hypothetical protein